MTITPRARFLEDKKRAASHRDLVVSSNYLSAAETALLETIDDLAESTDPSVAIAGYHRIVGARKFMRKFAELAETKAPVAAKENYNLKHNI
jgi:hypothetical protein